MPHFPDYHRQIQEARNVGLGLTGAQLEAFRRLLEEWADELASRVASGFTFQSQERALAIAREIIRQMTNDLARSTRNGIVVTAERVARIHDAATLAVLQSAAPELASVTLGGIGASTAQALLSRPELSRAFKSIRREAIQTVDRMISRAALRGASSTQLARELRLHILGADAFPERALLDRRRIGFEVLGEMGYEPTSENLALVRKEAGRISKRAQLIARTEIMNAEHETRVRSLETSPVVEAVRWKLSARHPKKDVCDLLAEYDIYGLGPGVYDPRRIPPRPHPRDLCFLEEILAAVRDWPVRREGAPPQRRTDTGRLVNINELPPSQERMLNRALDVAEGRFRERRAA